MSTTDWGRIGRRTEPFTMRVVCTDCRVEMSARALPETCPLCDHDLETVTNVVALRPQQPTLDLGGAV